MIKKVNTKDKKSKILDCAVDWDSKSIQKSADGTIKISGYANTKDRDRVGDVVLPEAFQKTLKEYKNNPILLYMHDWDKVIGKITNMEIDDRGLKVYCVISNSKDCEDIRLKIKEGILCTFSIGYNELDADWDKETATNYVKEIELLEISIVSIPCNTAAKFSVVDQEEESNEDEKAFTDGALKFMADALSLLDSSEEITGDFLKELMGEYVLANNGEINNQ